MVAIWRWLWTLTVAGLLPISITAYVMTRSVPKPVVSPRKIEASLTKGSTLPASTCFGEAKTVGICSYAQVCWEVRKPGC